MVVAAARRDKHTNTGYTSSMNWCIMAKNRGKAHFRDEINRRRHLEIHHHPHAARGPLLDSGGTAAIRYVMKEEQFIIKQRCSRAEPVPPPLAVGSDPPRPAQRADHRFRRERGRLRLAHTVTSRNFRRVAPTPAGCSSDWWAAFSSRGEVPEPKLGAGQQDPESFFKSKFDSLLLALEGGQAASPRQLRLC